MSSAASIRVRGLIFDLDGTLLDSLAEIGTAMNVALERRGLPPHAIADYRIMIGEGVEVLARRAAPALPENDLRALVDEYRAEYQRQGHSLSRPYAGIEPLLHALAAQRLPMAVLSNKRDDFTRALVAHHFHSVPFIDVRGERVAVPRKPHPQAALELAALLQLAPVDIGFVGDTAVDMNTARNAGMQAIGVSWGFRPEELSAAGARQTLATPADLLPLLA